VKVKPSDDQVLDVGEAVASLASPALGDCYRRFRKHLGFANCHERELALYRVADARLQRNQPKALWVESDEHNARWLLVLQSIQNAVLMNATDASQWSPREIGAAVTGLADIHAIWMGRESDLRKKSWIGSPRDARQWQTMQPLWDALAAHARVHNAAWKDPALTRAHSAVLASVAEWSVEVERGPRTLIHNDFNPRNIAICAEGAGAAELKLCAYDWELATIGLPQRDLAEFLCFVLPASASRDTIAGWLETSRCALERSSGRAIDRAEWEGGFRAALCELLVDRLATYAMVGRIRPQRFLPAVMRSWTNLHHHFPWTTP
jgi:thiamine kinase-like enzyme